MSQTKPKGRRDDTSKCCAVVLLNGASTKRHLTQINKIMTRYAELRSDQQEWASYRAETSLTDSAAGDGLPSGEDEYPEYRA